MYEPESLSDIAKEFPAWQPWFGTDQRPHARLRNGTATVTGEDLMDLRDQIITWIRRQDMETGSGGGCSL